MDQNNTCRNLKVQIGDETVNIPYGTPLAVIADQYYDERHEYPALLARVDGKLRELHKAIRRDCRISFVSMEDSIGRKTYRRSMNLLFLKAMYHVIGRAHLEKVVLHFAVGDGFYYTVHGDVTIDDELIGKVKQYMHSLVEKEIPLMKRDVNTQEAISLFHQYGMYDKEKLFRYRRVSRVNIYDVDGFEDYFYGFMVNHTGYLKVFDLMRYEEGIVLLMPGKEQPDSIAPFTPSKKVFQVQKEAEVWAEKLDVSTVGDLNERISQGKMNQLFLVSEALQEGRIARIAEEIASRPTVKFVMIAGPSSSGKTTFSRRLSIQLIAHGLKPHPISVDNYFRPRTETPRDKNGEYDFECLEALDVELFNQDMNRLLKGEAVLLPTYNFVSGEREYRDAPLSIGEDDVLVIEGIHCLNDAFSYSLPKEKKYKIYISALTQLNVDEHNRIPTTDGRLLRRMVRDNRTRGTNARETIARWPSVRRGEENNIFPYQEQADVIFNSALLYELSVIKMYAEPLLFQVQREDKEYDEAVRLLKFLDYFLPMPSEEVPHNSILREFIGGSCFDV